MNNNPADPCLRCGHGGVRHDRACPRHPVLNETEARNREQAWCEGYDLALANKRLNPNHDAHHPTRNLGWRMGDIEADRLANHE